MSELLKAACEWQMRRAQRVIDANEKQTPASDVSGRRRAELKPLSAIQMQHGTRKHRTVRINHTAGNIF